jgi:hypothetical protein
MHRQVYHIDDDIAIGIVMHVQDLGIAHRLGDISPV